MFTRSLCAATFTALCDSLSAQSPLTTHVVTFLQRSASGVFTGSTILGGPQAGGLGGGSLNELTQGEAGSVVLGFGVTIQDGTGADLAVFENGFVAGFPNVFEELACAEVSTDGIGFARFPSVRDGEASGGTAAMGSLSKLGGGMPVVANVVTNAIDPPDPVHAGGEHLDIDLLAQDQLVLRLGDRNSCMVLNPATLTCSLDRMEVPFTLRFDVMVIDSFDGHVATLHVPGPVHAAGLALALAISVRDDGGALGGDQVMIEQ